MQRVVRFIIIGFCILLVGCQDSDRVEANVKKTEKYNLIENRKVSKNIDEKEIFFTEENIYKIIEDKGVTRLVINDYDKELEKEIYKCEENETINYLDIDENNTVFYVVKTGNNNRVQMYNLTDDKKDFFDVNSSDVMGIRSLQENRVLVIVEDRLVLFDYSGNRIKELSNMDNNYISYTVTGDGKIVSCINKGNSEQIKIYDSDSLLIENEEELLNSRVWLNGKHGRFYYKEGYLYEFENEEELIDFNSYGIDYLNIYSVNRFGNKVVLACDGADSYDIYVFSDNVDKATIIKDEELEEKINLSFLSVNSFQGLINSFNKENSEYAVKGKMVPYSQFDAYIVTDKPDIIEIFGVDDIDNYAEKGYLQEISNYLQVDSKIKKENFHPCVNDAMGNQEALYTIPKEMGLLTLIGPTDIIDAYPNWTIEDYMSFINEYPSALSYPGWTEEETKCLMLRILLYGIIEEGLDIDSTKLEEYIKEINNIDVQIQEDEIAERLQDGEMVLFKTDSVSTPDALSVLKCKMGSDLTILGFPSCKQTKGNSIICFNNMLGITKECDNPEGAWQFIESYIENSNDIKSTFISTNKDKFEEMLRIGTDKEIMTLDGITYLPVTEQEIEEIRFAFDRTIQFNQDQFNIVDIILEEASSYFQNDKAIDAVMDIMISRLNILVREKR